MDFVFSLLSPPSFLPVMDPPIAAVVTSVAAPAQTSTSTSLEEINEKLRKKLGATTQVWSFLGH